MPGKVKAWKLDAIFEQQPGLRRQARVGDDRTRLRARRNFLEIGTHPLECIGGVDISRHDERRVRRMIVGLEKRPHVLECCRFQIGGLADCHPVIRMIRRKQRRRNRRRCKTVGTVLVILPPLVQHHVPLILELLLRQGRQQVTHAIGFHPQGQFKRVGRHHFPIVGAVRIGRSV